MFDLKCPIWFGENGLPKNQDCGKLQFVGMAASLAGEKARPAKGRGCGFGSG
jgi:hypothetical protein